MQRVFVVAVTVAIVVLTVRPAHPAAGYQLPVAGSVVGHFAMSGPYAPGHRGLDVQSSPGAPVTAMAAGRVAFAGRVVDATWVSVDHPDGLTTTVGPVADLHVAAGAEIAAGELLGVVATPGAHGVAGRVHLGVRRGDAYVDPMTILAPSVRPTLLGAGEVSARRPGRPLARLTLVPGQAPSPNHLVVLAGYGSSTGDLPFEPGALGYGDSDASQFSYVTDPDGDPAGYDPAATWQRVHTSAEALQRQLRRRWRDHPGQAVDLAGHSLGGLVAMYYLLVLHDPADPTLPPIGRVVTIASPLGGTEAAGAVFVARQDPVLRALVGLLDRVVPTMSADAPVMTDLLPGSAVTTAVQDAWVRANDRPYDGPLATGTQVLTIGAMVDPIVPEHRTGLEGDAHRTVLDTHGGAPQDPLAQETIAAFLAGEPLPPLNMAGLLAELTAPASHLIGLLELAIPLAAG